MDTWPSLKQQLPFSHAPCYREFPDEVEMVAVCDLDEDKCKTFCKRWDGDPGCSTYTAQLADGVFLIHQPAVTDLRFEVICTNGYIRIIDNNDTFHVYRRRGRGYSFDPVERQPIPPASSNVALVRDLIDCVNAGAKPLANEIVARNGMEILMGVAQSHLAGGTSVKLPLENRRNYIPSH